MVDNIGAEDTAPADEYRQIAAGFTARVHGATAASWDNRSPVPEWTARDVVRHLVEWFPPFLTDATGIELPPVPSVDDDPVAAWDQHSAAVQALLDDPSHTDTPFRHPRLPEMPLGTAVSQFYTADVFMHTWDLARATGQDERLDPERCRVMYEGMLPLDEMLRASGQYGPRVPVPDDADWQTKLLGFIGRRP
ncbi:TIGR03086 family metal-binding protein [Georgenia halophila]